MYVQRVLSTYNLPHSLLTNEEFLVSSPFFDPFCFCNNNGVCRKGSKEYNIVILASQEFIVCFKPELKFACLLLVLPVSVCESV